MIKMADPPTLPEDFVAACKALLGVRGIVPNDDREAFEVDFWRQCRGQAGLVAQPKSVAQLAELVKLAGSFGVPVVPQAGNTGLVEGGIPDATGRQLVISLRAMNRVRAIDPAGDYLICEAGCVLTDIHHAADAVDRMFPLSLGAQGSCRIGGNISTNAGGVNVLRYGMARDLVLGLEVILADGRIWNGLQSLRKDNTGYDLKQLFIGAEGTLGIVTAASLRLVAKPRETVTLWLAVPSPDAAVELYRFCRTGLGDLISSFELLTGFGVEAAATHLPDARNPLDGNHRWHLLIELAWSFDAGLAARAEDMLEAAFETGLIEDGTIAQSGQQAANMWRVREGQSEATRHIGNILRTDVSVRTSDIPDLIAAVATKVAATAPDIALLPFGHVGDGNLHFNMLIPQAADTTALRRRLLDLLYGEIDARQGSISAEHGVGRLKQSAMLARKSAVELSLMRSLKQALDPDNVMNPGVMLPAEDG